MNILNIIPIIGASWGILFTLFLTANKTIQANNRKAKRILILINVLIIHNLIDAYFNFNGYENSDWFSISYLHFHLIGFLILLYTKTLLKLGKIPKILTYGVVMITFARIFILVTDIDYYDTLEETFIHNEILVIDYFLALFMNIIPLVWVFFKLRDLKFAIQLSANNKLEFSWIRNLVGIMIIVYLAILQSSIISLFSEKDLLLYMKIDSLLTSFFFFGFAYLTIRFPIFTIWGDYNELHTKATTKKYAKSTLKEEASGPLWEKILGAMKVEKMWENPELRLNDLADKTGQSLHHVSQVINERKQMNFFDFVNQYRVEEAKQLLVSEKGKQFTILAIAFEVGFNSKTTFYNAFKKETGMTPSEFKKTAVK